MIGSDFTTVLHERNRVGEMILTGLRPDASGRKPATRHNRALSTEQRQTSSGTTKGAR